MKNILKVTIDGVPIGEIPEFLKKEMSEEEFKEFRKYDNIEESIKSIVAELKKRKAKN